MDKLTLNKRIAFLQEANSIGIDCLYPHSGSDSKEIQSEYDRVLPLYPECKARFDAERAEIIQSADEFLAPYRETRSVSSETWSAWFSMAVNGCELKEVLSLYESQPQFFVQWKRHHVASDWLESTIQRYEDWKSKKRNKNSPEDCAITAFSMRSLKAVTQEIKYQQLDLVFDKLND